MSTLAEEMKAHALEAQRFSRKHLVLELDFSPTSIQELEGQADSVTYAVRGGKTPENLAMLTRIWGAYVGESIRRATAAEWFETDAGDVKRPGLRSAAGAVVHPHEHVYRRLTGTKDDSLVTFFQQACQTLKG